jgi:hypothetical protein
VSGRFRALRAAAFGFLLAFAAADSAAPQVSPMGSGSGMFYAALPPTVTSVSPGTGGVGTSVSISGTNFIAVSAVQFGGVNASSYTVNSENSITATVPAAPSGTGIVNVTVTTTVGTSAITGADQFTYNCDASTGGSISIVGGFRVHTFLSSGTFASSGTCAADYIIVGGGAPGGTGLSGHAQAGGGGGGGQVLSGSFSFVSGNYSVTVGAASGVSIVAGIASAAAGAPGGNATTLNGGAGGNSGSGFAGGAGGGEGGGGGAGVGNGGPGGTTPTANGGTGAGGEIPGVCANSSSFGAGGGGGGGANGGGSGAPGGAGGSGVGGNGGSASAGANAAANSGSGSGGGAYDGFGPGVAAAGIVVLCYPYP